MGRELKRVPLDFNYPLKQIWYGYFMNEISTCYSNDSKDYCEQCKKMAEIKGIELTSYGCPDFDNYFKEVKEKLKRLCEVPEGEGYQLWETTTEGSPVSPIFETLDALCEWCEDNATTSGSIKATKEQWKQMLSDGFVYHQENGVIYM